MRSPGQVWKSHATMARDEGWRDPRCAGVLRVQEVHDRAPDIVRCDGCGVAYGIRKQDTPSAADVTGARQQGSADWPF